jgi:hypothetical protein
MATNNTPLTPAVFDPRFDPSVVPVLILNRVFATVFVAPALLFRNAAQYC